MEDPERERDGALGSERPDRSKHTIGCSAKRINKWRSYGVSRVVDPIICLTSVDTFQSNNNVIDQAQIDSLRVVRQVLGKWYGNGVTEFPTIRTARYREELEFAANGIQPFLHYEQRTWKEVETGEYAPSHWESGFWRALPNGELEVVSAQGGGRVEVFLGRVVAKSTGFTLELKSTLIGNDPRMVSTARHYDLENNVLQYAMQMCTTAVPDPTTHIRATLRKR